MELQAIVGMIGGGALPLIVAAVTMLAMISLRNGHLAERARSNVEEILYKLPTSDLPTSLRTLRFKQLVDQATMFEKRYRRGSMAFFLMSLALMALVAAATINAAGRQYTFVEWAPRLACVGVVLLACSLALVLIEVYEGTQTLKLNGEILAKEELHSVSAAPHPKP